MPGRDGTGPMGTGPRTGRGGGSCQGRGQGRGAQGAGRGQGRGMGRGGRGRGQRSGVGLGRLSASSLPRDSDDSQGSGEEGGS
jgi:hypothetical protein